MVAVVYFLFAFTLFVCTWDTTLSGNQSLQHRTAATLQLRVFVGAHLFQVHVHLCESPAQLIAFISCRFGAHLCCLLCSLACAGPWHRKAVTEVFVVCGQVHEQSTEPLAQLLCSVSERGGGRLWFLQL